MAQTAVGDLVVNLDVNSSKFNEQMEYVKRQFKQTGDAANDSALKVQQSFTRQESAAKKAGISVGQYNAAMRMLPAQFTDIATQLAGGQSPWLILLQQGGQVKDSFGGIMPTFRALLGTISPVMVGVGALAAATGAVVYAWYQGSSTLSDFNKTLVLSGNTAGLTSNRMLVLAKSGEQAGLTFNQTSNALTELVNAGVRAGARFDDMSQAVAKFTDASGVPVDKVAAAFGKLTNDPTSGLIAMAQQFHNVTAEQIAYVAQLQRAGDEAGALQAANDAATNGFREQTKSLRDNMGSIETAADSLKRAFKSMWDAALDIGRPDTTQEMVAKAEAAFKRADEIWNLRKGDGYVNDDARASYWNDRESARLALEMAQQQASVAKATEDNAYADAMEPVFEQPLVARYGFNQLEMTAIGCTRQSEANRKGRWGILTNNKDRVVSFDVGLDGNIPQPGYIIAVSDELLSGKVMGGRIIAVNGRVIKFDRVADAAAGDRLILNLPSGASQSRTIQAVNGESVTVTTAYSETPQAEAVWVVESDELYAQQYRVVSVSDNNDGTFSITGAWHDPDKYARIDTGAIIDQRPVSVIPPGNQSPPANIVISSFSVVQQNISVETMRVSWDQAQNAIAYEAQWRRNDGNWVNVPRSSTNSFDVSGIYAGRYLVRVRAINAAEISSGWGYSEEKTLTGKVGNPPKPVGFATTPINWGIRLNWGFPANTGDTLKTEIQYTANSDFSNPLLLSDVPYPSAEYTQLGLKAGQEFWYRAQLVDRTGNESGWTDWVRGESNANADDYLGDIADDFLTSADGDRLTGDIDTNLEAALQNALANHATVEHQWAQYGEVRADILVVKTTIAQVDKAMAEMSTQVQAQFNDVTAALEDKLTAVVDATGASAIYTLKTGVRINGVMYNAGMSIAVLAEAGKPVVTRVGFNANQFVLMSGSGNTQYPPFAVVNGQVFISDAFIQDGSITNAKIGNFIQSNNFVAGSAGWRIDKNGNAELHGKLYADSGQFAFNGTNNTVVINGNGLTVNLSGGGRVVVGRW